jgi:endo-1,4-beta-xylanase
MRLRAILLAVATLGAGCGGVGDTDGTDELVGQQSQGLHSNCTATYRTTGQWPGGFMAEVRITNNGENGSGWVVAWTYPDGQVITSYYNANVTQSGPTVTVRSLSWNGSLRTGGSATMGVIGQWTGSNSPPATLSCSIL